MKFIDTKQIDYIRKDLEKAIKEVAEKHGVEFNKLGTIRYGTFDMSCKLEMTFDKKAKVEMLNSIYDDKPFKISDTVKHTKDGQIYEVVGYSRTGKMEIKSGSKSYTVPISILGQFEKVVA